MLSSAGLGVVTALRLGVATVGEGFWDVVKWICGDAMAAAHGLLKVNKLLLYFLSWQVQFACGKSNGGKHEKLTFWPETACYRVQAPAGCRQD